MQEFLTRIEAGLMAADRVLRDFIPGEVAATEKEGGDPLTEADIAVNRVLLKELLRPGEGWLSEESVDDNERLRCDWVWIVDPIDGTKEFVAGIPEWCVSVGLSCRGEAVAGGILNREKDEMIVGAREHGVFYNGRRTNVFSAPSLSEVEILASRSEFARGEWDAFVDQGLRVRQVGSVAYKLSRVAAGHAEITWSLTPKNEWDVAAGVALVQAAGGFACLPDGKPRKFNSIDTTMLGMVGAGNEFRDALVQLGVLQ